MIKADRSHFYVSCIQALARLLHDLPPRSAEAQRASDAIAWLQIQLYTRRERQATMRVGYERYGAQFFRVYRHGKEAAYEYMKMLGAPIGLDDDFTETDAKAPK